MQKEVEGSLGEISKALLAAEGISTKASSTETQIAEIAEEIFAAQKAVVDAKVSAESSASDLKESIVQLNETVENSKIKADAAVQELDKALLDARRQGLAKAFNDRYLVARREYFVWAAAFLIAIGGLVWLGWMQFSAFQYENKQIATGAINRAVTDALISDDKNNKATNLIASKVDTSKDLTELAFYRVLWRLLSELPLALPIVWLGWYSAKRIGAVSRLMQDYEYKAAAALAFESYKKEVVVFGNDDLSAQLLQLTIKNFGDNPVRLFDTDKNHAHPMESFADSLKDEKVYNRLIDIIDRLRGK